MSQRGETNRLVYEADLLLRIDSVPDDALVARTRALEEGAALLLEQALVSLLVEIDDSTFWQSGQWRGQLMASTIQRAELIQLAELLRRPDSWLSLLLDECAAVVPAGRAATPAAGEVMIATTRLSRREVLTQAVVEFKALAAALRHTNEEW
ncbi:DUF6586 family protein [Larsenimonas rhizosphaerae]|uniref:DUF6586 family protein n=1 Tax=Larsenimonas rhizosphaerae TaxID=2944682 RepID=UPI002033DD7D|nr:DUF6586 family protein [Larsenimonas rhizosphaerae]MCM2130538.1 hypothetical protein [Larsenimonas rhizosphaerae]